MIGSEASGQSVVFSHYGDLSLPRFGTNWKEHGFKKRLRNIRSDQRRFPQGRAATEECLQSVEHKEGNP
jgi:hypothetical protein